MLLGDLDPNDFEALVCLESLWDNLGTSLFSCSLLRGCGVENLFWLERASLKVSESFVSGLGETALSLFVEGFF